MPLLVDVHVTPGSSTPAVGGRHGEALRVRVRERAVDGAATEATLRAVADAFGLRRRDVRLERGDTSRARTLRVEGDESLLRQRLAELLLAP